MPRIRAGLPVLAAIIWLNPSVEVAAAERGAVFAPAAPPASLALRFNPRLHHAARAHRFGFRHGHGRRFFGPGFVGAPWYYPFGGGRETVIYRDVERPSERSTAEYGQVLVGIPAPPRPEPVIYRIEGPRHRQVVRIIRIPDGSGSLRAEEGARMLPVPRR